jgi:hypothetical protein
MMWILFGAEFLAAQGSSPNIKSAAIDPTAPFLDHPNMIWTHDTHVILLQKALY